MLLFVRRPGAHTRSHTNHLKDVIKGGMRERFSALRTMGIGKYGQPRPATIR